MPGALFGSCWAPAGTNWSWSRVGGWVMGGLHPETWVQGLLSGMVCLLFFDPKLVPGAWCPSPGGDYQNKTGSSCKRQNKSGSGINLLDQDQVEQDSSTEWRQTNWIISNSFIPGRHVCPTRMLGCAPDLSLRFLNELNPTLGLILAGFCLSGINQPHSRAQHFLLNTPVVLFDARLSCCVS